MHWVKRILFPADSSASCASFAVWVADVANRCGAEVTLLYIEPNDHGGDGVPLRFQKCTSVLEEQVGSRLRRKYARGNVVSAIIEAAESESADLIMMPSRGGGLLPRLFTPSIVDEVLLRTTRPVWTAWGIRALRGKGIRHVVCAVDLSAESPRVLSTARDIADLWNAKLSSVHVMPDLENRHLQLAVSALDEIPITFSREEAEAEFWHLQRLTGARSEFHIQTGETPIAVRNVMREFGADLLVIGPGQKSAAGALGSNVRALVRAAPCPVLVLDKTARQLPVTDELGFAEVARTGRPAIPDRLGALWHA